MHLSEITHPIYVCQLPGRPLSPLIYIYAFLLALSSLFFFIMYFRIHGHLFFLVVLRSYFNPNDFNNYISCSTNNPVGILIETVLSL